MKVNWICKSSTQRKVELFHELKQEEFNVIKYSMNTESDPKNYNSIRENYKWKKRS